MVPDVSNGLLESESYCYIRQSLGDDYINLPGALTVSNKAYEKVEQIELVATGKEIKRCVKVHYTVYCF